MSTQDGVTADQVAEVQGHHAVCEELRKHMHGDRRPLSKVSPGCVLYSRMNSWTGSTFALSLLHVSSYSIVCVTESPLLKLKLIILE